MRKITAMLFVSVVLLSVLATSINLSVSVSADSTELTATQDAYISQGSPNARYGGSTILKIGCGAGGTDAFQTFMQFDVSAFAEEDVTDATLTLSIFGTVAGAQQIDVRRVTSSWSEGTANGSTSGVGIYWYGAPSDDSTIWASTNVTDGQSGDITINITTLVQAWCDGTYTNYGIQIKPHTVQTNKLVTVCSKEHVTSDRRPMLTIDLPPEGPTPPFATTLEGTYEDASVVVGTGLNISGIMRYTDNTTRIGGQNIFVEMHEDDGTVIQSTGFTANSTGDWYFVPTTPAAGSYYTLIWFDGEFSEPDGKYSSSNVLNLTLHVMDDIGFSVFSNETLEMPDNVPLDDVYHVTIYVEFTVDALPASTLTLFEFGNISVRMNHTGAVTLHYDNGSMVGNASDIAVGIDDWCVVQLTITASVVEGRYLTEGTLSNFDESSSDGFGYANTSIALPSAATLIFNPDQDGEFSYITYYYQLQNNSEPLRLLMWPMSQLDGIIITPNVVVLAGEPVNLIQDYAAPTYVSGMGIYNAGWSIYDVEITGALRYVSNNTLIPNQNLFFELHASNGTVLRSSGFYTDEYGYWSYPDVMDDIRHYWIPPNSTYYVLIWFDGDYSEPMGYYASSAVKNITVTTFGGNWINVHSFDATLITGDTGWTQVHRFVGTIPIVTSLSIQTDALIMGLVWLMVLFMPAIMLNALWTGLGYIVGMALMATVLGFSVQDFWFVAFLTYAGLGMMVWRGDYQ